MRSESKIYDMAIIGLGPAGATFARLLDKKYSVIAFDKKTENENSFKKPCGGLLAPDAQKFFSKFGLTLPVSLMVNPQLFSVKTIDVKTKIIKYYQRFYINLDRHKFDIWLKSHITNNVKIVDNTICTKIEKENDYYKIYVKTGNKEYIYKSKYIVGADGANSTVRKFIYPNKKIREYLSIQEWYVDKHETPFYSCIFNEDITDSYVWGLTKNDCFIFGGAFFIKTAKSDFEKIKMQIRDFGFKLDNPIKRESCMVLRPSNPFEFCTGKENIFLIGEAAGFISPSSLEGISYAFESAYILSNIFNNSLKISVTEYKKAVWKIKLKLMLKLVKNPFMYNRFLRKIIMKSGIQSIDIN